jgi:hypothetical protein
VVALDKQCIEYMLTKVGREPGLEINTLWITTIYSIKYLILSIKYLILYLHKNSEHKQVKFSSHYGSFRKPTIDSIITYNPSTGEHEDEGTEDSSV